MKIVVALCMLLAVSPVWAGTLTDSFNDPNMDDWIEVIGNWSVDNGELVLGPSATAFGIGETIWKDYTVGVSVKITEHQKADGWTQGALISVRAAVTGDGYRFGIGTFGQNPKQALAYRADGGVVKRAKSVPFEWELNTFYDLKFVVEGNVLKHYIDDELVVEYTDNIYPAGGIAISVIDKNNVVTAHFDDFYITGDDVTDTNLPVKSSGQLATLWAKVKNTP